MQLIEIENEIKRNVAQLETVDFSKDGKKAITIRTENHQLSILGDGLSDGDWTFSGSENGTLREGVGGVSAAYINNTYPITNNTTTLQEGFKAVDQDLDQNINFIGVLEQNVIAQQINLLPASNLVKAKEIIKDGNSHPKNKIIVFRENIDRIITETEHPYQREDNRIMCKFSFGVVFHGDFDDNINKGKLTDADLINTCVYIKPAQEASFVTFDRKLEDGYSGQNKYFVIYMFNYEQDIFNSESYKKRKFYFQSGFTDTALEEII